MQRGLAHQAISEAFAGNWKKCILINKQILKSDKKNVDALNRLARSYAKLGDIKKARKTTDIVLKINPFDPIAQKAYLRWKEIKPGESHTCSTFNSQTFIEEPGKTKIVTLLHLGSHEIVAEIDSGDEVIMAPHGRRISVTTNIGKYLGRLPDDLSARLKRLIQKGYEYKVHIKSNDESCIKVFIREDSRPPKFSDYASFPLEKLRYVSFTPPEKVHDKSNLVTETEED